MQELTLPIAFSPTTRG